MPQVNHVRGKSRDAQLQHVTIHYYRLKVVRIIGTAISINSQVGIIMQTQPKAFQQYFIQF